MNNRPVLVVENDPFPRLLQAFLDAQDKPERTAAIADFIAHDIPDYTGWLATARAKAPGLYPAEVRLVSSQDDLRAALAGADAVVVESLLVGRDELERADRLRVVQKYGTVVRNIDTASCEARNIRVLTVRRRANIACAEYAFGLMLVLAKKLLRIAGRISLDQLRAVGYSPKPFDRRYTSSSNWARAGGMRTLHGTTLGIIGLGEIGREVALRAAAFGMPVVYYQRTRLAAADERALQVEYCAIEELLGRSDWLFPLLPSDESTRGFLDNSRLALVKPGAILVNVARAELVERIALERALASGQLAGLGLDTFYEEPGSADDPLLQFDNVIVTPRVAAQPRHNAFGDLEEVMAGLSHALG